MSDAFERWTNRATRTPVLSREEERSLVTAWRERGDKAARDRLVIANLRLVLKLAREVSRRTEIPTEDLVSEGCAGLLRALDRYDLKSPWRFISYASHFIRGHMARAASGEAEQSSLVTDDEHARAAACQAFRDPSDRIDLDRAIAQLTPKQREVIAARFISPVEPLLREVGEDMGVSREGVRQTQNRALTKLRTVLAREARP